MMQLFLDHPGVCIYADDALIELGSLPSHRRIADTLVVNNNLKSTLFVVPKASLVGASIKKHDNIPVAAIKSDPASDKCVIVSIDHSLNFNFNFNARQFPPNSTVSFIDDRLVIDAHPTTRWVAGQGNTDYNSLTSYLLRRTSHLEESSNTKVHYRVMVTEANVGQMFYLPLKPGHGYYQVIKSSEVLYCQPISVESFFDDKED